MQNTAVRFYDRFAPLYPVLDVFLHKHKRTLTRRVNDQPEGRLLEIGVGQGRHLKSYKHRNITGIDASRGMLAFAEKNAPKDTVLKVMDANELAFDDASFDYAVIAHVLTVVPDPARVMGEVHRVLEPGGKVFILNRAATSGTMQHAVNRVLEPLVSNVLRFSSEFDETTAFLPDRFTLLERTQCGILPNVTLFILQKKCDNSSH